MTWELVATNNSRLSGADPSVSDQRAELPGFLSHLSDAGLNSGTQRAQAQQIVQELMDSTGQWRQARVDLSSFAGAAKVQLRFDFSTAGAMRDTSLGFTDANFGEFTSGSTQRSIAAPTMRLKASTSTTSSSVMLNAVKWSPVPRSMRRSPTSTQLTRTENRDPNRFPDIVTGPYQLEVRRTDEYAALIEDGIIVVSTFDSNDRHINEATQTALVDYEVGGRSVTWAPTNLTLGGVSIPAATIAPWTITSNRPFTGQRSLESGSVSGLRPVSVFQATPATLGSTETEAGMIEFAYSVSSREDVNGLRFFIDGVPQTLDVGSSEHQEDEDPTLASGEVIYRVARFTFGSGNPTFTWVYDYRDNSNLGGQNRAWIDDIKVLQGGTGLNVDRNRPRPQGMFIIDSNTITDSSVRGINVQPGVTQGGGTVPHPGRHDQFPAAQSRAARSRRGDPEQHHRGFFRDSLRW